MHESVKHVLKRVNNLFWGTTVYSENPVKYIWWKLFAKIVKVYKLQAVHIKNSTSDVRYGSN